jgi:hypothetical protein
MYLPIVTRIPCDVCTGLGIDPDEVVDRVTGARAHDSTMAQYSGEDACPHKETQLENRHDCVVILGKCTLVFTAGRVGWERTTLGAIKNRFSPELSTIADNKGSRVGTLYNTRHSHWDLDSQE